MQQVLKNFIEAAMLGVLLYTAPAVYAAPRVLDRLVLEIEKTSFTQRQFEIYWALRGVLVEQASTPQLVGAYNYRALLERYTNPLRLDWVPKPKQAVYCCRNGTKHFWQFRASYESLFSGHCRHR